MSYSQFRKVFSYFLFYIHTFCAERFKIKYFARISRLQNTVYSDFCSAGIAKKRPETFRGASKWNYLLFAKGPECRLVFLFNLFLIVFFCLVIF
jgi:hypothetical protein